MPLIDSNLKLPYNKLYPNISSFWKVRNLCTYKYTSILKQESHPHIPNWQKVLKMKINHIRYSLIFLAFISVELSTAQPYKTLVLPITRDSTTSLFSIPLEYRWGGGISPNYTETYLIGLDGALLWRHCPSPRLEIGCAAPECNAARSLFSPICPPSTLNASDSKCKCITSAVDPINGECDPSSLSSYTVIIPQTNGRNPVGSNKHKLYVSCASFSFSGMGVAGLSQAPLVLLTQVNPTKKFAPCLPSTKKAKGMVFFGDGPYYLKPKMDLRTVLYYTPLLKHPLHQSTTSG